jgi:hypothetical protein
VQKRESFVFSFQLPLSNVTNPSIPAEAPIPPLLYSGKASGLPAPACLSHKSD